MNEEEIKIFDDLHGERWASGIMPSNYCVMCYPKKERAIFIYNGNSLCEECFNRLRNKPLEV
jgi:hypothetical protein